jgi:hypothetical protein
VADAADAEAAGAAARRGAPAAPPGVIVASPLSGERAGCVCGLSWAHERCCVVAWHVFVRLFVCICMHARCSCGGVIR